MTSYYLGGALYRQLKRSAKNGYSYETSLTPKALRKKNNVLVLVCVVLFGLLLLTIGTSFFSGVFMTTSDWGAGSQQFYLLLTTILPVVIVIEFYLKRGSNIGFFKLLFRIFNKKLLVVTILFMSFFLIMGDRGPAITIGLVLIGAYSYLIRGLRFRTFLLVLIIGSITMTVIGVGRSTIESEEGYFERVGEGFEDVSFLNFASGLIINNRALYVLYEHAQEEGFYFGQNYIASFLSIVPSMERLLVKFDALDRTEISTANIVTYLGLGPNAPYGLGTNLIGGIYLSFGLIGVVVLMFLLGRTISIVEYRSHKSLFFVIVYIIFLSYAIYLSRAELFLPIRVIVWTSLLYYLFYRPSSGGKFDGKLYK